MVSLIDRRRLCAGAVAAAALPAVAAQAETNNSGANDWLPPKWRELGFPSRRWVNIVFVHTNERFKNIYCEAGEYIVPAVKQFSWTCRDYRRGEWEWIHPMLLDLLFVLHWKYNKDEINIFSGYRTPGDQRQYRRGGAEFSAHIGQGARHPSPEHRQRRGGRGLQEIHLWRSRHVSAKAFHASGLRTAAQLGRLSGRVTRSFRAGLDQHGFEQVRFRRRGAPLTQPFFQGR